MNYRANSLTTLCFLFATACGSEVAEFGPPRELPAAQRPTVWDAPTKVRLPVVQMGPVKQSGMEQGPRSWTGDTPAGWQSMPANPSGFKDLVWQVAGEPDTECYFTAGVGGGVAMNLPRWYGQFQQNDVPPPESLPVVELAGASGRLVEIKGSFKGKSGWAGLIAFASKGDQVTSLKFTGPEAVVTANRDKFLALAKSLRASGSDGSTNAGGMDPAARSWTGDMPAGWQSMPANPSGFKDLVWQVVGEPDTECYFTAGVGGGVAMNLPRWYGQFQQNDVPAPEALPVVELAGRTGRLVEVKGSFKGKSGWAGLIAFATQGEQVSSLKFTGPEAVVTANREKFLALAKSLRSATSSPNPQAPPIDPGTPLPQGHMPIPNAPTSGQPTSGQAANGQPAAGAAPFTATAPTGWSPKAGSPRLLHHTFGTDSEVYLSQLGGSMKATLDIWRNEMSMAPMTDAEFAALPKVAFLGEDATLLDLKGKFQSMTGKQIESAHLVVAARLDGTTITFCKMVGPASEVDAQVDNFRLFCGSVRRVQ